MYSTRSRVTISDQQHRMDIERHDAETSRSGGGVGIPGGRKAADVKKFSTLKFSDLKGELGSILSTSTRLRGMDTIQAKRKAVAKVNRRILFGGRQAGVFSLHAANDIAAVWNSHKRKHSRVYDYPKLARKLDHHLFEGGDDPKLAERRQYVARGMQEFIGGDLKSGRALFKRSGMNPKASKWAYKMASVMLAERGRELHSGKRRQQVFDALGKVGEKHRFTDVFVSKAKTLAPFAKRGGAKSHR